LEALAVVALERATAGEPLMFDCAPPARLHVGQYELEADDEDRAALPLLPHVGQYTELEPAVFPLRIALDAFEAKGLPRCACCAEGRVAPWVDRKVNDDASDEIALILLPLSF